MVIFATNVKSKNNSDDAKNAILNVKETRVSRLRRHAGRRIKRLWEKNSLRTHPCSCLLFSFRVLD